MRQGSAGLTEVVTAPPDKIIDALTEFESFPEWQAQVLECEVLERDDVGRGSRVRMTVDGKVRKIRYVVRYHYDLPDGLGWEQESGDLQTNTGQYTFAPRGDGSTAVTLDIVADVGFYVPRLVKSVLREQALRSSMRDLKRRVER